MTDSPNPNNPLPEGRTPIPGLSIVMATFSVLLLGFVFTVGCTMWSLARAGDHPERELEMLLLYMGLPLLIAAGLFWGAVARYRAAARR